jgi:nucleoside 2-deoxyribosyltransferase
MSHVLSMIVHFCSTHGDKKNPTLNENTNNYFRFYYDDKSSDTAYLHQPYEINMYPLMTEYPKSYEEKIDKILLFFSRYYPQAGDKISLPYHTNEQLFCDLSIISNDLHNYYGRNNSDPIYALSKTSIDREKNAIIDFIISLDYMKKIDENKLSITYKGWSRIEELIRERTSINQGFIAMSFAEESKPQSEAIKQAIDACGYSALRMDEMEHNNQIVPELFFQIERSKFLVIDVTVPNYGAYYEAGYALALKKAVIVCCSKEKHDAKDKEDRPHFDIAQKAMVVWKDPADLIEKLKRRIEATVGLNN